MAIYHLSVKPVQRSKGRSAVAAAAYRAGEKIEDRRTGLTHDFSRKSGVIFSEIVTPTRTENKLTRAELWNEAEAVESRVNSTTAREYEIALPAELDGAARQALAMEFAQYLCERYQCAADVCIHAPSGEGDDRNFHAHIMTTTREFTGHGLTVKNILEKSDTDRKKLGFTNRCAELLDTRGVWADMENRALARAGVMERVDHRSNKERGLDEEPTVHVGPTATAMARRGADSERAELSKKDAPQRTREAEERASYREARRMEREKEREGTQERVIQPVEPQDYRAQRKAEREEARQKEERRRLESERQEQREREQPYRGPRPGGR